MSVSKKQKTKGVFTFPLVSVSYFMANFIFNKAYILLTLGLRKDHKKDSFRIFMCLFVFPIWRAAYLLVLGSRTTVF